MRICAATRARFLRKQYVAVAVVRSVYVRRRGVRPYGVFVCQRMGMEVATLVVCDLKQVAQTCVVERQGQHYVHVCVRSVSVQVFNSGHVQGCVPSVVLLHVG